MSAEINGQHPGTTLPNPHKGENIVLLVTGGVLVCTGFAALFFARNQFDLDIQSGIRVATTLAASVVMMLVGIRLLALAFKQLQFVFVMENLAPLAELLEKDEQSTTMSAESLRLRLRNNQPLLLEPRGAIDGLLFRLVPAMSQTPSPLVRTAVIQFFNGLVLGAILLSFLFAMTGGGQISRSWVGLFYFVFSAAFLMRAILRGSDSAAPINIKRIVALLVVSAIVPLFINKLLTIPAPGSEDVAYGIHAALLMVAGLLGSSLFVMALRALTQAPPITDIANAQRSLTLHTSPMQIFEELGREMPRLWVNKMPNRTYLKTEPNANGNKGTFTGELIEETMPQAYNVESLSLGEAIKSAQYRGVVVLDLYGAALSCIAALLLLFAISRGVPDLNAVAAGSSLLAVGFFCLTGANKLWRRFEFRSRIYWIEARGSYQNSRADFGAQFHGEARNSRETTFVEAMTLRVWCAELTSVAYNLKNARFLVHISGHREEADRLLEHLSQQATGLGSEIKVIEQVTSLKMANTQQALVKQLQAPTASPALAVASGTPVSESTPTCTSCLQPVKQTSRFCENCGSPVIAAALVGTIPSDS